MSGPPDDSDTEDRCSACGEVAELEQPGGNCWPCTVDELTEDTDKLRAERDELRRKLAETDGIICWDTTCANCARLLDKSYEDYARAEQRRDAVLALCDQAEAAEQARMDPPGSWQGLVLVSTADVRNAINGEG